jgi:type IV secretory pathway VirB2 component (pilin)
MAADVRARNFLLVVGTLFLLVFALPLLIAPFSWAEAFGWDVGPHTDLAAYFGRCLGAVATALTVTALVAARDPSGHRWLFGLFALAAALLVVVHVIGLLRDAQPLIEHLEIAGYAGFAALALWCRPPSPHASRH